MAPDWLSFRRRSSVPGLLVLVENSAPRKVTIALTTGQVVHIVLFQWNSEAAPEAIDRAVQGLRDLKDMIPGILELSCGVNFTDRGKGFTHGLLVRFTDKAALDGYGPHPAHQAVVRQLINPIRADVLAFDYEE